MVKLRIKNKKPCPIARNLRRKNNNLPKDQCFKCGYNLIFNEAEQNMLSSQCKNCGQEYAKEKGKSLPECRGNSSFTLALYFIIFEKEILADDRIAQIANQVKNRNHEKWIRILIKDIEEEIKHPTLKTVDLIPIKGTEAIARDYLSRLSI